jgi:hypothetical protein
MPYGEMFARLLMTQTIDGGVSIFSYGRLED